MGDTDDYEEPDMEKLIDNLIEPETNMKKLVTISKAKKILGKFISKCEKKGGADIPKDSRKMLKGFYTANPEEIDPYYIAEKKAKDAAKAENKAKEEGIK